MPSGYLKNTEGVSAKKGRGSSSKDAKYVESRKSPRSKRARYMLRPSRDQNEEKGTDTTDTPSVISRVGTGRWGAPSGPKLRGPAARNATKMLVRESKLDVDPSALAAARLSGRALKVSACESGDDDGDDSSDLAKGMAARVDAARMLLVRTVREARAAVTALETGEKEDCVNVLYSRAYSDLRVAEATLQAFDDVPVSRFLKQQQHVTMAATTETAASYCQDGMTYHFEAVHKPDWAAVTQWKRLAPGEYDSTAKDLLGDELGEGTDEDPIVELSCTTPPGLRCIFRASVAHRCLQTCPKCPTCGFQFAIPGPQPSGSVTVRHEDFPCEGFRGFGTITLTYSFPSGTQGPRMKRPGSHYMGTSRTAYLPANPDGQAAVALLIKAFLAGALFVVDDSVTTGMRNCVVWGSVHQKTSPSGGTDCHGWPDATYFERLLHECASVGVFTDRHERALQRATNKARQAMKSTSTEIASAAMVSSSDTSTTSCCTLDTTVVTPTSQGTAIRVEDKRLMELNVALQEAMRTRDMDAIRLLMRERTAVC